ncbi:MAG: LPS biosynthesis protein PseA [Parcubacteria group bacterium]|jgi:N-acetyl sugar amidotransferase|nr:LPS biosynthesis protein PseA [Parcubacteria group bacterium]|tara:strand:+ start:9310 stop:10500 length:1191 start_codon:yes stop_codon:yes gene_type:complete
MTLITLDKQIGKLPKKIKFCKNCVVSNQRPRTDINSDGICSACVWSYEKNYKIDWKIREKELKDLLDKHRKSNGEFDIVVPSSGGKDSAFVAHQLKHKYGMTPVCVTWAPAEWSYIGRKNLEAFTKSGYYTIASIHDGVIHRKLCTLGFEYLGQPFAPFIYGQKAFPYHIANQLNISLIMYGENGELEYGGSTKYKYQSHESPDDWQEFYFKGTTVGKMVDIGYQRGFFKKDETKSEYFKYYKAPDANIISEKKIEMHWFSYFKKWIPQENYYYGCKFTDFRANDFGRSEGSYTKYASLDDKLDGLSFYLSYIKFGLGRASRDAQQDIRMYHITRDEGVRLVQLYDGEFPKKYFQWYLDYLNINEDFFFEVIDFYRNLSNVWEKRGHKWNLKYIVK